MARRRLLFRICAASLGLVATVGLVTFAFRYRSDSLPRPVSDLPLIEVMSTPSHPDKSDTLAIMLSGDGGWAGLDKSVGKKLAHDGIPVVGWSSLRYYLHRRSPTQAAYDLARVINYYTHAWNRSKVLLIGYSRGADVLPAIYNRLPSASRARVNHIVLLGLAAHTTFGYSLLSWIGLGAQGSPVLPEARKLPAHRVTCVYGVDDPNAVCDALKKTDFKVIELPGGHHFDHRYGRLARIIIETSKVGEQ